MDDDGAEDWGDISEWDDDPTRLDEAAIPVAAIRDVTAPHLSGDFLAGREAGFTDGVAATVEALRDALEHVGVEGVVAAKIVERVRAMAENRG